MAARYNKLPSEMLHLDDEYEAYCLDEACAFIQMKLDEGEDVTFKKEYNSFESLYSQYS